MAQVIARITLKRRWWVMSYISAMRLFAFCFAWAIDDDVLADWINREAAFIAKHGFKMRVNK